MKAFKILIIPIILCVLVFKLEELKKGKLDRNCIAFTSYNAHGNDSFSIITLKPILANSTLFFTNSKWNGNHFSINENHLVWNSGKTLIPAYSIIEFQNINTTAIATTGSVYSNINLDRDGDVIFAYSGNYQMPERFLAAISTDSDQYGTLLNTKLSEGINTLTLTKGCYSAQFKMKSEKENNGEFNFSNALYNKKNFTLKYCNYHSQAAALID